MPVITFARMAIGEHIRELRLALGLSQDSLGQRTGLTGAAVSLIELGKTSCTVEGLLVFSEALGVEPVELLEPGSSALAARSKLYLAGLEPELVAELRKLEPERQRGLLELLRSGLVPPSRTRVKRQTPTESHELAPVGAAPKVDRTTTDTPPKALDAVGPVERPR